MPRFRDAPGTVNGGIEMKSKQRIGDAANDHEQKTALMNFDGATMDRVAKELGWTRERLQGYQAGVAWAYSWVLSDDP